MEASLFNSHHHHSLVLYTVVVFYHIWYAVISNPEKLHDFTNDTETTPKSPSSPSQSRHPKATSLCNPQPKDRPLFQELTRIVPCHAVVRKVSCPFFSQ